MDRYGHQAISGQVLILKFHVPRLARADHCQLTLQIILIINAADSIRSQTKFSSLKTCLSGTLCRMLDHTLDMLLTIVLRQASYSTSFIEQYQPFNFIIF